VRNAKRLWQLLVVLVAAAEILASATLVYCASCPVILFQGSVEGWVSLTSYKVVILGQLIDSQIYDYVEFMSVLVFLAAGLAAVFSATALYSLLSPRWQRVAIPGLFASSLVLLVALSITQALARLILYEARHIEIKSVRTSAGLIEFPREKIILTHVYSLVTGKPLLVLILLSVIASAYILYTLPEEQAHRGQEAHKMGRSN